MPMTPDQQLSDLLKRVQNLENNQSFNYHHHTGTDSSKVNYGDLVNRKIWLRHTLPGTAPATASNFGSFFIVPVAAYVSGFQEVHETAGTDAGSVTVDLEKLTGTTAPGSGTVLTNSALSLKATANTVQTATLITTLASINCAVGDRLALKLTGTPTSLAGVTIMVELTLT